MVIKTIKRIFHFLHDAVIVKKYGLKLSGLCLQVEGLDDDSVKRIMDSVYSEPLKMYCESIIWARKHVQSIEFFEDYRSGCSIVGRDKEEE